MVLTVSHAVLLLGATQALTGVAALEMSGVGITIGGHLEVS